MTNIDKHIPIPSGRKGFRNRKYPFGDMEVGDSYFVEGTTEGLRARYAAQAYAARNEDYRFSYRTLMNGTRIWRVPAKDSAEALEARGALASMLAEVGVGAFNSAPINISETFPS